MSKGIDESRSFRPIPKESTPSRILVIRLHAIGDVAITLPSCIALKERYPSIPIDFLTTEACAELPKALTTFERVYVFPSVVSRQQRVRRVLEWCAKFPKFRYDVIIDLQSNWVSRALRRSAFPKYWSEFDRFSLRPAGDRVVYTVRRAGLELIHPTYRLDVRRDLLERAREILHRNGWDGMTRLIVFNPAGVWKTRNWPIEYYAELGRLISHEERTQFLLLGTERIVQKAQFLEQQLAGSVMNLVGKTSLGEALAILQYVNTVVTEDSGLMHMAWVSGVPTVALFGSSRHDWSRPLGEHSLCLNSGDLECGSCMKAVCPYGDVHCLTRYSAEYVYHQTQNLLHALQPQRAS
jgi:ADP-heptose:LPS heptosyltransferase